MQSDRAINDEAEISSFPPKTSYHHESLISESCHEEINTMASTLNRSLSSHKSKKNAIETKHSAPNEGNSISRPYGDSDHTCHDMNSIGNAVFVSAAESPLMEMKKSERFAPSDHAEDGNTDLVENGGRFTVPPPRYSTLCSISLDEEGESLVEPTHTEQNHIKTFASPSLVSQTSGRENVMIPSTSQEKGSDTINKNNNVIVGVHRDDEYSKTTAHDLDTDDGETLSNLHGGSTSIKKPEEDQCEKQNFGENASNKDFIARRRSRQRRKQRMLIESRFTDDETSIENYGAVTESQSNSLQERSHQAWKSRQRKNATMRLKNDGETQSQKESIVSFGASDTIHHFDPNIPKRHKYKSREPEEMSIDRSLNSEYTKTLESEVEDMIKDIFLIGSPEKSKPGRRKYRYKSDIERKVSNDRRSKVTKDNRADVVDRSHKVDEKSKSMNDSKFSVAEKTEYSRSKFETDTVGDETYSLGSTLSRESSVDSRTVETFQSEKDTVDDPLTTVIGLVEGGISVMASAIDYALGEDTHTRKRRDTIKDLPKRTSDYDIFESCGLNIREENVETASTRQIFSRTTDVLSKTALVEPTVSRFHQTNSNKAKMKSEKLTGQADTKLLVTEIEDKLDRPTMTLGNNAELFQLSMHAAKSVHKLKGVEYDEAIGINMYKEVKKIQVSLELPLGIIFLENDGGCFVTKVSRDGSAAKSRKVMVGDQLALINGTSGNKMKVDDICDAVSRSTAQGHVELVFLRYVGPFRPSTATRRPDDASREIEKKHDASKEIENKLIYKEQTSKTSSKKKSTKKKTGFRLFGIGKKSNAM